MASNSGAYRGAIRRLVRDLNELAKEPCEGIAVAPIDDNIFHLHANLKIPAGPYRGLLVHFELLLAESYPVTSPKGRMAPGFPLTGVHHEHIYGTRLCTDYLSDFQSYFNAIDGGERKIASGWSSGITLKSLMIVLKQFFSETDLPTPPRDVVKKVFRLVKEYKCPNCDHSTPSPVPPLPSNQPIDRPAVGDPAEQLNLQPEPKLKERARSLLVCSASKENFVDSPDLCFGYPINLRTDYRDRLWTTLFPELMSYEQYALQIQKKGIDKLENFNFVKLRTANGYLFTHWLPVYINKEHYSSNLQCVKNTLSVLSHGVKGTVQNEFSPCMVLRVLPALMNKMVVAMMEGSLHESESAIYAYCHYLRLLMALLDQYEGLQAEIEHKIELFLADQCNRKKEVIPDIGEFLVLLSLSQKYAYSQKCVQIPLLGEYFARQVLWLEQKIGQHLKPIPSEPDSPLIPMIFEASSVSNKLLVFNLMAAKWFIFKGVKEKLDEAYGLPPEPVVTGFQALIKKIKSISSYPEFFSAISFPGEICNLLYNAWKMADTQGYTNTDSSNTFRQKRRGKEGGRGGEGGNDSNSRQFVGCPFCDGADELDLYA